MGLKRKKVNTFDQYEEAIKTLNNQNNFHNKTAQDRIIHYKNMTEDDIIDAAKKIKEGYPITLCFDNLDLTEANKNLSFISGVCFALDATIIQIHDKAYLFSKKDNFFDGSLANFIDECKR